MDNVICYLNTDLDLTSADNPTELGAAFEAAGMFALHVTHGDDGLWIACFETGEQHTEPEGTIAALLGVIESLPPPLRTVWDGCQRREFNIGYDCGREPWAFNQVLSTELLARLVASGGYLRITLYPDREPINRERP